jgi:hypothetical protein
MGYPLTFGVLQRPLEPQETLPCNDCDLPVVMDYDEDGFQPNTGVRVDEDVYHLACYLLQCEACGARAGTTCEHGPDYRDPLAAQFTIEPGPHREGSFIVCRNGVSVDAPRQMICSNRTTAEHVRLAVIQRARYEQHFGKRDVA